MTVDQNTQRMIFELAKRVADLERYVGYQKPLVPQPQPAPQTLVEAVDVAFPVSVGRRELPDQEQFWVMDANKKPLFYCLWGNRQEPEQICSLLNELADLRNFVAREKRIAEKRDAVIEVAKDTYHIYNPHHKMNGCDFCDALADLNKALDEAKGAE